MIMPQLVVRDSSGAWRDADEGANGGFPTEGLGLGRMQLGEEVSETGSVHSYLREAYFLAASRRRHPPPSISSRQKSAIHGPKLFHGARNNL
jgi:hypothetical protein